MERSRLMEGDQSIAFILYLEFELKLLWISISPFEFIGTNAYWLHTLNTNQDIINTFTSIKATGISVVRVWAFNGTGYHPVIC
jgi:hypothetical protein